MRFHIGFSKRINIKSLIALLGTIFLGFLAFFGLIDHAYADSSWITNFNFISGTHNPQFSYYAFYDHSAYPLNTSSWKSSFQWGNANYNNIENYCPNGLCPITIFYGNGVYVENNFYFKSSTGNIDIGRGYPNGLFEHVKIPFGTDLCMNGQGTRSVNIKFKFRSISPTYANTHFFSGEFSDYGPITDINDYLLATIETYYDSGGIGLERQCSFTNMTTDPNDSDFVFYDLLCNAMPSDDEVESFSINFYNKYEANLSVSDLIKENATTNITWYSGGWDALSYTLDYQCSINAPIDPNIDDIGQSNIDFARIDGNGAYSDVSGQLNLTWFDDLDIPQSITNLFTLPYRLVNTLTGMSGTCQPIYLDFSSFTQRFGGFNYQLQLPCMRAYLSNLLDDEIFLNLNFYEVLDMLVAFGLTIMFAKHFYNVVSNIISGDDLTNYFSGE